MNCWNVTSTGERNFNGIELIPVPERVDGSERSLWSLEGTDLVGIGLPWS